MNFPFPQTPITNCSHIATTLTSLGCLLPFPTRFVKGKDSVFGKVADYWYRFEEQGRGSLHLHLLLWIEDPDDPPSATTDSQEDVDDNGDPIQRYALHPALSKV